MCVPCSVGGLEEQEVDSTAAVGALCVPAAGAAHPAGPRCQQQEVSTRAPAHSCMHAPYGTIQDSMPVRSQQWWGLRATISTVEGCRGYSLSMRQLWAPSVMLPQCQHDVAAVSLIDTTVQTWILRGQCRTKLLAAGSTWSVVTRGTQHHPMAHCPLLTLPCALYLHPKPAPSQAGAHPWGRENLRSAHQPHTLLSWGPLHRIKALRHLALHTQQQQPRTGRCL